MFSSNLTMMTDLYELTMMQGYFLNGNNDTVVFDMFYRTNPSGSSYAITCGLQQVIDYVKNLSFSYDDIDYLRGLHIFREDFLSYLAGFHFSGDIYAIPEGSVVFPKEPLIKVIAPIMEAQLVETAILNIVNHQSLIATKASRVDYAAGGGVMEFGLRRAQGPDAGTLGARAAVIGGCTGTSNVLAGELFGIPVQGTHAHAWIMSFPDEYTAFHTYANMYPDACILLVDTYDTVSSGIPNAIKAFKNVLLPMGITDCGIRLDSGDIAYLSKKARKMLDDAGLYDCKIVASNSLDEYIIKDIIRQGACVDTFGVGERLITAESAPVFGAVYKLVAVETENGQIVPKIKLSENTTKITNPHFKKLYRYYDKSTGMALADEMTVYDETVDDTKERTIFDPVDTWKKKTLENFTAKQLLVPVFLGGKLVYESPAPSGIRAYCAEQVNNLWDEIKRFENPHKYYVDLSEKLWNIKMDLVKSPQNR